jgi:hypothetical protein
MGFLPSLGYSVAIFGLVLVASVGVAAIKNITITVPDGSSNHGDPNLLFTPSSWTDIITFYVGNYAAHAATVISLPGESTISTIRVGLSALLFPCKILSIRNCVEIPGIVPPKTSMCRSRGLPKIPSSIRTITNIIPISVMLLKFSMSIQLQDLVI